MSTRTIDPRADAVEQEIYDAYRARTPNSAAWHERASDALVGGVSGTVRYFSPYPSYFSHGDGALATDIDDNTLIDHFLCGATLLLGHRHPQLVAAQQRAAAGGSLVLNPVLVTEVAEQLQAMVPAAERVRFLNSGTEAVMTSFRFARAFTGRTKIVKFLGTYHGMEDQVLVGLDTRGIRLGQGIPPSLIEDIVNADFTDLDQLAAILAEGNVAAVLVDPSMHHGGLWAGDAAHYEAIQKLVTDAGSLLIFDEVISGFRLAAGGAQEYFGITPDLAVFGKALGAGERFGAVVGRADVMGVADPSTRRSGPFAFQSGTCNDSFVAMTSAATALEIYAQHGREGGYTAIAERADRLGRGLTAAFAEHDIPCFANTLGPMVRLFLTNGPRDYLHCSLLPSKPISLFHLALLTEGVLTLPGSNDFFLSFAHTDDHIDEVIAAAHRALERFDIAALLPDLEGSIQ